MSNFAVSDSVMQTSSAAPSLEPDDPDFTSDDARPGIAITTVDIPHYENGVPLFHASSRRR
ncbi:hypothetical protein [Salinibacterium sp.]|uniref:hypothetical protein n=1 Tax=Salinibacterium sp. TaxID=1915057 RepID=UPI00286BE584|nr:hypothetical protein [Salinibacterium sp.]